MQDNELLNQIAELTAKINDLPNCPPAGLTWSPRALGSGVSRPTVWPTPGGASPRSICLCGIDASVVELTADVALHHVLRRQVLNRLVMCSCNRATLTRAFSLRLLPFVFRES